MWPSFGILISGLYAKHACSHFGCGVLSLCEVRLSESASTSLPLQAYPASWRFLKYFLGGGTWKVAGKFLTGSEIHQISLVSSQEGHLTGLKKVLLGDVFPVFYRSEWCLHTILHGTEIGKKRGKQAPNKHFSTVGFNN